MRVVRTSTVVVVATLATPVGANPRQTAASDPVKAHHFEDCSTVLSGSLASDETRQADACFTDP
jgi:hypothetical protein